MKKILTLFFIFISFIFSGCAKKDDANQKLRGISQNIWDYIKPEDYQTKVLDEVTQKKKAADYISHYFSPWTGQSQYYDINTIKEKEQAYFSIYQKNPGFGENYQPYSIQWIDTIIQNVNLEDFAKHPIKAIITAESNLRVLPTNEPSYSSLHKAGQFYPFDNLQESYVSVGTPVLILLSTRDGAWDLIVMHNDFGWIPHQYIAYVDDNFIHHWENGSYGVVIQDHTPVYSHHYFIFNARLGSLYPIPTSKGPYVYIPIRSPDQQATIALANINQNHIQAFPLDFTYKNVALLIEQLLGNPYGWGGMYGYRDCSATVLDVLAPFGIWLPRNSHDQMQMGNPISLINMNRKEKKELISSQGKPFLTVIGLPGHIVLYIGTYNHRICFFQQLWGLHTGIPYLPFLGEGRAIIGKAVITPIDFDHRFINVPTPFIDKIDAMTTL